MERSATYDEDSRGGSLRWRLVTPLVTLGVVCALLGGLIVARTFSRQLDEQMQRRGESIASAINATIRDVLYTSDPAGERVTLVRYVADLGTLPDVTLVVVVTGDPARVAASTNTEWVGRLLTELPYERVQEDLYDAIETRRMHTHFHWETAEYDVSWPLALNIAHRPRGVPDDGAIMLHLDARPVRAQLMRAAAETIGAILAAIVAMGGLVWLLVDRMLIRRVSMIESAMALRARGESDAFAPDLGHDEIGRLGDAFNSMLRALDRGEEEVRRARDYLEEQVRERTADLLDSHARLRRADRMATIGTMAAGVAHDLNNLLLPIRLRLGILGRGADAAHRSEALDDLRQSVRFLQQLADSLRLCAVDPADPGVTAAETHLHDWWAEVGPLLIRAFRTRVGSADAAVEVELRDTLPAVRVPAHRLTQAALNLVVNAGDACRERRNPALSISGSVASGGEAVALRFSDNGSGMEASVVESAFDPFYTTKPRGASTGLGLSIVRGIAESSGGTVTIDTTSGNGTSISLHLPIANASAPGRRRGRVVAVTIDDERLASFVVAALTRGGMLAATVTDGAPPDADVWVVEASAVTPEQAARFLESRESRGVVLLGDEIEGWTSIPAVRLAVYSDAEDLLAGARRAGEPGSDGDDNP